MGSRPAKEFAAQERVTARTVRRWIEKGAIDTRRTPGGGVRILPQADKPLDIRRQPSS